MRLTDREIDEILDHAPVGATHMSGRYYCEYVGRDEYEIYVPRLNSFTNKIRPMQPLVSLGSLKEIRDLRKLCKELEEQNAQICRDADEGVDE